MILSKTSYPPWLWADGSTGKRHGEQGRTGTRSNRQETISFLLSMIHSAVLSQQEEEAIRAEYREDKHGKRNTGGKD